MNLENLGYEPPTEDELRRRAEIAVFGGVPDDEYVNLDCEIEDERQKDKEKWLKSYSSRNGPLEIGVCFNAIGIGRLLNAEAKSLLKLGVDLNLYIPPVLDASLFRLSKEKITKSCIFRLFNSPDEVDAYFQALDDSGVRYVELEPDAISVLKQLKPTP